MRRALLFCRIRGAAPAPRGCARPPPRPLQARRTRPRRRLRRRDRRGGGRRRGPAAPPGSCAARSAGRCRGCAPGRRRTARRERRRGRAGRGLPGCAGRSARRLPVETTQSARPARALTASCSRSRKRASPYSAKMAGIAMPASASISASRSAYSIPSRRASQGAHGRLAAAHEAAEDDVVHGVCSFSSRYAAISSTILPTARSENRVPCQTSWAIAACQTSISMPPTALTPRSRAWRRSSVSEGL